MDFVVDAGVHKNADQRGDTRSCRLLTMMVLTSAELTAWVGSLLWPFFRVAALFSVLPVLGGRQIPRKIRALLAVFITLSMQPLIGEIPLVEPFSPTGIVLVVHQILIGLIMGFVFLLVFNTVILAGQSIAITMGLGFALMNDPQNGSQVPVIGQFFSLMATLLFLALNGHHAVLQLMADSFSYLPITQPLAIESLWHLIAWSTSLFSGALKIALPAIVAMLTVNVIMGVMTRAAPQLNVFSVGFPITMTVGFVSILASLPSLLPNFEAMLISAFDTLSAILQVGP